MPIPPPGSIVWIRLRRWRVERARLDRRVVRLEVTNGHDRLTFLAPFDRPVVAGRRHRPRQVRPGQALAWLAGLAARHGGVRTPMTALAADVVLLPHQFDPVLAMLRGARRVLVADEAGLGKTIQAGLILAEVLAREPSAHVLIVVPAALRAQWVAELHGRFGIDAATADRHGLEEMTRSGWRGDNPWARARVWIASLDFLKQRHVRDALPVRSWDLVIIDEAHDACGDSDRYDVCAEMLRRARRVLLLTATPHPGDHTRFNRLVHLGTLPDLEDSLVVFRRTRASLGWPTIRRVSWTPVSLSEPETRVLDTLKEFERRVLTAAGAVRRNAALLLLSVLRKRALSTAAALDRSLQRRLDWLVATGTGAAPPWAQQRLAFEEAETDADEMDDDERAGLCADVGLDPRHEQVWLRRLRLIVQQAIPNDSKVRRLLRLFSRTAEPVVLFTEFRDSLEHVRSRVAGRRVVATAHGGQSAAERTRELTRFLDGSASLLIATDVAGQGLNLQGRSRWVVSLELPWNPARLTQRVGRVDRIGQRRPVHATLLAARHEAEAGLLGRLARRVLTAQRALGADALDDTIPPGALAVAAMLLAGEAECHPTPAAAAFIPSQGGAGARAVVHVLARKRRLASRWRGPVVSGRPLRAALRRRLPESLHGRDTRTLLVFRAPVVTRAGAIVEAHAVVVAVDGGGAAADFGHPDVRAQVTDIVTDIARRRLWSRLVRLRRLLSDSAWRQSAVDRALAQHVRAVAARRDAQPGLFGARGVSAEACSAAHLTDLDDGETRTAAGDLDLSVATVVLEAILLFP